MTALRSRPRGYALRLFSSACALLVLSGYSFYVLLALTARQPGNTFALWVTERQAQAVQQFPTVAAALRPMHHKAKELAQLVVPDAPQAASPVNLRPVRGGAPRAQRGRSALENARGLASAERWEAAIDAYARLAAARPRDHALIREYARVVAWSGDHRQAARLLERAISLAPADDSLQLEYGRVLWWGGQGYEAERVLTTLLKANPNQHSAAVLRYEIRAASSPQLSVARAWLLDNDGPVEHLLLARAYVREQQPRAALVQFRLALETGALSDSVFLELAAAAADADSANAAAAALGAYLARHPQDRDLRVRLARTYAWAKAYPDALRQYDLLLGAREDPTLRFERARIRSWSRDLDGAAADLVHVVAVDSTHATALKMLGDFARWRGDHSSAERHYARAAAVSPATEGLTEALAMLRADRAGQSRPNARTSGWETQVESFGDSERFRWMSAQATRTWQVFDRNTVRLVVRQNRTSGSRGPGLGATPGVLGIGVEAGARRRMGALEADASVGVAGFEGRAPALTGGVSIQSAETRPAAWALEYRRDPAVRQAGTVAALEASARSDRLRASVGTTGKTWSAHTQLEYERFTSEVGGGDRIGGSATLSRVIVSGVTGTAGVDALAALDSSPALAGWGPLYWAPRTYVAPRASLAYSGRLPGGVRLGLRAGGGYAFLTEGTGVHRYDSDRVPYLAGGFDLSVTPGSWQITAGGDWQGGPASEYRAGGVTLRARYTPTRTSTPRSR
jgi:tetratricopeptide (TPR) repeat protein